MSNPKCPLCKVNSLSKSGMCTADDAACFGIVLRDVVPMHELAYKICTDHVKKITRYYDIMDAMALEEELERSNAKDEDWDTAPVEPVESVLELQQSKPKKDLN